MEVENGTKDDDGKRSSKGRGADNKFDGYYRYDGKYGHKSETCWTTSSTKTASACS